MVWENSDLINDTTQAFVYELELVKDDNTFKYIGYTGTNKNWKEYIQSSEYVKKDKEYITKKTILKTFECRDAAYQYEIQLIKDLNAVKNPIYYNRANYDSEYNVFGLPSSEKQLKQKENILNHPYNLAKRELTRHTRFFNIQKDKLLKDFNLILNNQLINEYEKQRKFKDSANIFSHKVLYLQTNEVFETIAAAQRLTGVPETTIRRQSKKNTPNSSWQTVSQGTVSQKFSNGQAKIMRNELKRHRTIADIHARIRLYFQDYIIEVLESDFEKMDKRTSKPMLVPVLKKVKQRVLFDKRAITAEMQLLKTRLVEDIKTSVCVTKNATANINTLNPLQGQNKKVQCTKTLQIFDSVAIASLKTNTPPGTISHHARGKSKNPLWKFVV